MFLFADLGSLRRRTLQEFERIVGVVSRHHEDAVSDDTDARVTYAVIEFQNAWSFFNKAYYISCSLGTRNESGEDIQAARNVTDENEAIGRATLLFRKKAKTRSDGTWRTRDEPAWHDVDQFLKICESVSVSNLDRIQAAFSPKAVVFEQLPTVRNYFAHRNWDTVRQARIINTRYGIAYEVEPTWMLLSRARQRPQPILLDWVDTVRMTIEYLCH